MYSVSAMMSLSTVAKRRAQMPSMKVWLAYGIFLGLAGFVYHFVANGRFTVALTVGEMLHCLAAAMLVLQVMVTRSVAGISARSLGLEVLGLCCRLSSTLWLHGYLPTDASGDGLLQGVNLCALALILGLLHQVVRVRRRSYMQEEDSMPVLPTVLGCLLGGALLHANLNRRPLFDAMWMAGHFLGIISVLPQFWLITRAGGRVDSFMSHYIAMTAVSRAPWATLFWLYRHEITCVPWIDGVQHAILALLAAHLAHALLMLDFGYHYVKSVSKAGLACVIETEMV